METSIYSGFSMAILNNQMVSYLIYLSTDLSIWDDIFFKKISFSELPWHAKDWNERSISIDDVEPILDLREEDNNRLINNVSLVKIEGLFGIRGIPSIIIYLYVVAAPLLTKQPMGKWHLYHRRGLPDFGPLGWNWWVSAPNWPDYCMPESIHITSKLLRLFDG